MTPKFCVDCKYSFKRNDDYTLKCNNPTVNSKDAYALSSTKINHGASCTSERSMTFFNFPACGIKGKQWSPKSV